MSDESPTPNPISKRDAALLIGVTATPDGELLSHERSVPDGVRCLPGSTTTSWVTWDDDWNVTGHRRESNRDPRFVRFSVSLSIGCIKHSERMTRRLSPGTTSSPALTCRRHERAYVIRHCLHHGSSARSFPFPLAEPGSAD